MIPQNNICFQAQKVCISNLNEKFKNLLNAPAQIVPNFNIVYALALRKKISIDPLKS